MNVPTGEGLDNIARAIRFLGMCLVRCMYWKIKFSRTDGFQRTDQAVLDTELDRIEKSARERGI